MPTSPIINQDLSIYIPYMEFLEDPEEYIKDIFQKFKIGKIRSIQIIELGRWIKET